jgi:hypothetical protein
MIQLAQVYAAGKCGSLSGSEKISRSLEAFDLT